MGKPEKNNESFKEKISGISKKNKIIIAVLAAVAIALIVFGIIFFTKILPGMTPKNDKMMDVPPEVLEIPGGKTADVTAITGTDKDKKGITDKENHKIFDTGFKFKLSNGKEIPIYTTGKKDSNGNVIYTLNQVDDVGKLVYYTGVEKDGKLELKRTNAIPDYTTNDNSKLTTGNRYSTTKTIKYTDDTKRADVKSLSSKFVSYSGGSNEDVINRIVPVEGGYIVAGTTNSKNGNYGNAGSSWKSYFGFISKINNDGKYEWTYVTGGDGMILLRDVAQLKDGTIVAVGQTSASDTEAPRTGTTYATLIVKLDKNGNELWTYSFPCHEEEIGDEAYSIAATPDGGFVVGGKAESTTGFFKNADGNYKAYLFKFDRNGKIEWRKVLGGSKSNKITAISVNDDGEVFATCVTLSYDGNFTSLAEFKNSTNNPNTVVLKLDKDGKLLWSSNLAGWGKSEYNAIAATSDGGCVVGGTMSIVKRANGSYSQCNGSTDGYVVRFSKDGQVYWAHNIGGTEADDINGIAVVDNMIVVTGGTSSTNYNFAGLISGGARDAFVSVLDNSGAIMFSNLIGGKGNDWANTVCITGNGLVVAGVTQSTDGVFKGSAAAANKSKAFVKAYDFSNKIDKEK